MAAMHWEARRRWNLGGRRESTSHEETAGPAPVEETKPEVPTVPVLPLKPINSDKEVKCSCQHTIKKSYKAKIDNRYSSIQYNQQW